MKQNSITDLPNLSLYRYENFLNIYEDDNNFRFYNLLRSINVFPSNNSNAEISYFVKGNDTWPLISFKNYNTMELWWLVCTYNNIQNPVIIPEAGTELKILKPQLVSYVLSELKNQLNR